MEYSYNKVYKPQNIHKIKNKLTKIYFTKMYI